MNHSGSSLNPSHQVPKVEPGTQLSVGAEQSTNGTVAGGAAAGGWTNQGLATGLGMAMGGAGVMGAASKPPPPLEAVKTRKKGLSVACPIAYGSLAFLLERKKQSEFVTHRWTLFVRGPNGEDISYFVSKVVFTLHPSFAEATRAQLVRGFTLSDLLDKPWSQVSSLLTPEIKSPPFEVTEMGWGEFEAKMTMHFKDPNEKPVDVLHQLRLYHDPATGTTQPKKAVVAEFYDEVVFTDPYEEFYNTLMQGQKLLPQRKHEHQEHFSTFSDGDTLQRLAAAREWVHNQLRETKDKIRKADMDMAQMKASATPTAARGQGRPTPAQSRR